MLYNEGQFYQGHGIFMGHEPCPACRKQGKDREGNNLGRWEDGHAWCFSCSYRESSTAVKLLENVFKPLEEKVGLSLPEDVSKTIPSEPLQWLSTYGIMREEILSNDITWSEHWGALIFPIKDADGNLLAFQARRFRGKAKWTSHGNLNDLTHILGDHDDQSPIVLVEDIVSAIRVSRTCRAMPIFGSHVNTQKIHRLRFLTKRLVIWLDSDKYAEAIKTAGRAEMFDFSVKVVYTELDPKEHSDITIAKLIES